MLKVRPMRVRVDIGKVPWHDPKYTPQHFVEAWLNMRKRQTFNIVMWCDDGSVRVGAKHDYVTVPPEALISE